MTTYTGPGVSFDKTTFDPMRIMPVTHQLMGHPLLELPSLIDLAKRLEVTGSVRSHGDDATPATDFTTAPKAHPIKLSVDETIRRIESSKAWMALHNIQNDPTYRMLVDEVLDYVKPMVEEKDPGMCHRAGWIFVTSPGAITPYHMDHEHNFILQVLGKKTINVFDPLDRSIVTEPSLELFHAKLSRDLVVYKDEFQKKAHVFEAEPGMGAYMPTTAPHWVKNGDNVSITVSFTYYTKRTLRDKALYRGNYALRQLGLSPHPVHESTVRDAIKHVAFRAQGAVKQYVAKAPVHPSLLTDRYAIS
jgi:hypothetical protein